VDPELRRHNACSKHNYLICLKNIKIDICVNEECGAVHLDPGEMEKILEGEKGIFNTVKSSIFSVFK
jgi:Zn-finger nucleic acid-binding protein